VPSATTTLSTIKVSSTSGVTSKTSNVSITSNLNAGETSTISAGTQPANYSRQVTVYDTLGNAETLQLDFYATTSASAAPTWKVTVTPVAAGTSVSTTTATGAVTASLTFGTTGALTGIGGTAGATSLSISGINWNNGSGSQTISLNLSNLTQQGAPYSTTNITQDGTAVGQLSGVSISSSGYVQATYSNGVTKNLYQIPLALFPNQNGLLPQTGNTFASTVASGNPVLQAPGVGGAGSIVSSALESSNVDLATQFTNMIITQRAYSAGTKVISTIDQMLQDLDHIQ
jgi:flagellar hook protein FlgE